MAAIKETAERLWSGQLSTRDQHPFTATGEIEEIAPKVAFCRWLGNFTVCKTDEGLVLIDTGSYFNQDQTLALIRTYSTARIHTVIYTHGHLDHAGGTAAIVAEAGKNRVARPRVVGHRAIAERLDLYKRAAGYNRRVDDLLYGSGSAWPADFVYPDTYFDHQLNVVAGATNSSVITRAERPRTIAGFTFPPPRFYAPAISSSGPLRVRAIRSRHSAIRATGQRRCARWRRAAPRCCCRAMAVRFSARCASVRRSMTPRNT